jgi:hypothetical protein
MGFSLDKQANYRTRTMQHPMFYCNTIYVRSQQSSAKNAATAHHLEKYKEKNK